MNFISQFIWIGGLKKLTILPNFLLNFLIFFLQIPIGPKIICVKYLLNITMHMVRRIKNLAHISSYAQNGLLPFLYPPGGGGSELGKKFHSLIFGDTTIEQLQRKKNLLLYSSGNFNMFYITGIYTCLLFRELDVSELEEKFTVST